MPKLGYLLPTRERIMAGQHETEPMLALAERAENLGFDSLWVGDSLLARARHEPLTMLAAVAARTKKAELGTAVLLPALRNPTIMAHMAATVDQLSVGRLILGVGIATDVPNVRNEFAAAECRSRSGSGGCWKGCGYAGSSGRARIRNGTVAGTSAKAHLHPGRHRRWPAYLDGGRCSGRPEADSEGIRRLVPDRS